MAAEHAHPFPLIFRTLIHEMSSRYKFSFFNNNNTHTLCVSGRAELK